MAEKDDINWLKQTLRATFPYLVFMAVFIIGTLCVIVWAYADSSMPTVLERAHSHNDYYHERPLEDALDAGFCSVEADIYLIDGALLVAHDRDKVSPEKTLVSLYLEPLWERFKRQGSIHATPGPLTLLIDIKSDGTETFNALHQLLQGYAPMLTDFSGESVTPGAVTIILSGNRDVGAILSASPRLAGVDGRLGDLDGPMTARDMPLVSDNWTKHFTWRGNGEIPAAELVRLREVVALAHQKGMRLRFWATPQTAPVWTVLYENGVDLLNADDLEKLRDVILSINPEA